MIGRSELCQGLAELVAASQRVMAIDHLDRLIERSVRRGRGLSRRDGGAARRVRRRWPAPCSIDRDEDQAEDRGGGRVDVSRDGEPDAIRALGTKVGQQLAGDRHERAGAGRIDGDSVAMGLDVAAARSDPAVAVVRHFQISDDAFGGADDDGGQLAAGGLVGHEEDPDRRAGGAIGEGAEQRGGDRLIAKGAAVGSAIRDGVEEWIAQWRCGDIGLSAAERHLRGQNGLRSWRRLEATFGWAHFGGEAERSCCEHDIFDRTADTEMHLATERIEGPEMTTAIGEDTKRLLGHVEQPGLGVVRAGREDGRAQGPAVAGAIAAWPLVPGGVRGSGRTGEDAAIPGSVAHCAQGQRRCASRSIVLLDAMKTPMVQAARSCSLRDQRGRKGAAP